MTRAHGHGAKLGRKRQQALAALLSEPSLTAAAAKVNISEKTLRNWLSISDFSEEYRRLRRGLLDEAVSDLQAGCVEAARALRRNLSCGKAGDEIKAAVAVVSLAMKGHELFDLAAKLAEIEERLKGLSK